MERGTGQIGRAGGGWRRDCTNGWKKRVEKSARYVMIGGGRGGGGEEEKKRWKSGLRGKDGRVICEHRSKGDLGHGEWTIGRSGMGWKNIEDRKRGWWSIRLNLEVELRERKREDVGRKLLWWNYLDKWNIVAWNKEFDKIGKIENVWLENGLAMCTKYLHISIFIIILNKKTDNL